MPRGERPLGISTIYDRVAQMAVLLILEPIFEVDLAPNQYGFRPVRDAKEALKRVSSHIVWYGRREIIDADLKDYFNRIPHGALMKCLSRRVVDGQLLSIIKAWLEVPVYDSKPEGPKVSTEAKDRGRGTPQGSPLSPLLANLYFRRFIKAWEKFGHAREFDAYIVNYADDFVICTRPGNGTRVMAEMKALMTQLGLEVNEAKTRQVRVPEGSFDFLGYLRSTLWPEGKTRCRLDSFEEVCLDAF